MAWVVNTMPCLFYSGNHPVSIVLEGECAQGLVWTGAEYPLPAEFDPRTFQPIDSRYTDYAIL